MSDRHFKQIRNIVREKLQIIQVKIVAGIDSQVQFVSSDGSFQERLQRCLPVCWKYCCIRLGIQFYAVCSGSFGGFQIIQICPNKDGSTYIVRI